MRIIAGSYKGRKIKSPPDLKTRPTSDRLRETLFNIIGPQIDSDTRFLDLCAGTGAVGIEAISRGAGFTVFVDRARSNCGLIEKNLDLIGVPEADTQVKCIDAAKFISQEHKKEFNFVFYDPPYSEDYSVVLSKISDADCKVIDQDSVVIVEHHFKNNLADEIGILRRWRIVRQGETSLSFFESN